MIELLIGLAILAGIVSFFCCIGVMIEHFDSDRATGTIVKRYLFRAKMLNSVKIGTKCPWGTYGEITTLLDGFACHVLAFYWSLFPIALVFGIIATFIWALTTITGLMIIGVIVAFIAAIWGTHKCTRLYINVLCNFPDSKLVKFCSNVNKVVNEVKVKESE